MSPVAPAIAPRILRILVILISQCVQLYFTPWRKGNVPHCAWPHSNSQLPTIDHQSPIHTPPTGSHYQIRSMTRKNSMTSPAHTHLAHITHDITAPTHRWLTHTPAISRRVTPLYHVTHWISNHILTLPEVSQLNYVTAYIELHVHLLLQNPFRLESSVPLFRPVESGSAAPWWSMYIVIRGMSRDTQSELWRCFGSGCSTDQGTVTCVVDVNFARALFTWSLWHSCKGFYDASCNFSVN